jgi:hypothetical protein
MNKDLDDIFYSKDAIAPSLPKFFEKVKEAKLPYKYEDVKKYYDKQEIVQQFRPYKTIDKFKEPNKLITFDPFKRFWVDTMYFSEYKMAIVCGIDLFTKYGFAKPYYWKRLMVNGEYKGISSEQGLKAVKQFVDEVKEMGYKIDTLIHDQGSEFKGEMSDYLQKEGIKQKVTNTGDHRQNAPVERFNGTLRRMIKKYDYIYGGDMFREVKNIVKAYNNNVHKTIGVKPKDVIGNEEVIKEIRKRFFINQRGGETLQRLEDGARVRLLLRKEDSKFNKIGVNWSKEIYKVVSFDRKANTYKVDNGKEYRYNQLLPVEVVRKYEKPKEKREKAEIIKRAVQVIEKRQTRGKKVDYRKLNKEDEDEDGLI